MSRSFCIAALLGAVALAAPTYAQPTRDHLGCYKVKDRSTPKGKFTFMIENAGVRVSCFAKTPAKLGCLESSKTGIVPTPPGGGPSPTSAGNFLCYQAKCSRPFPPSFPMADQFGSRVVTFKGAQLLCAPATRGSPTTPSPTTTSTTLPGAPASCTFSNSDQRCEGSCGNGGRCSATASSGACECRTVSCGNADTPQCNGFCSEPSQACVFSVTGCSCVRIP